MITRQSRTIGSKSYWLPTFIGVGAPKCATTWLSENLRHHPDVFMSNPKELRFFVGKFWQTRDLCWYLSFFDKSAGKIAAGEFTTSYCLNPEVPARIYHQLGPVKIIMVARHPTDRFISHYQQKLRNGTLPENPFRTLNQATLQRVEKEAADLFHYGHYAQAIHPYLDQFGTENVLVLVTEEIAHNPAAVRKTVYEFVGVSPQFEPTDMDKEVRRGIVPKNRAIDRFGRRLFKQFDHRLPHFVNLIRRSGFPEKVRLLNAAADKYVVEATARQALDVYYQPHIEAMEQLLKRELTVWRRSRQTG